MIARNPPPAARPDQGEAVDVVPIEARVFSMSREAAKPLIASLYAGRAVVLTWTDVKKERHTARIDPSGFAGRGREGVWLGGHRPLRNSFQPSQ